MIKVNIYVYLDTIDILVALKQALEYNEQIKAIPPG